jgi:hypothetical protein
MREEVAGIAVGLKFKKAKYGRLLFLCSAAPAALLKRRRCLQEYNKQTMKSMGKELVACSKK